MSLPLFGAHDDPGPDLAALLRQTGRLLLTEPSGPVPVEDFRHGTTCIAIRYADGVVLAGDRRATSGNLISHRRIEKVFPADRHSGVAISGAAGPAVELVRLFQLQLEHYEKVEGSPISLEGKANQLGQMIRGNLPAAMQGLVVIPIFGGFDVKQGIGRLFEYDITGGRYEEADHAATGSGSLHAGTVVKLGYRAGFDRTAVIDLAIEALYHAADEDSATGGPDLLRGIYPVIATITADGYERADDDELAQRTETMIERIRDIRGEGAENGSAKS